MDDVKGSLKERQALRYELLKQLYQHVNGSQSALVDFFGFAAERGVKRNDADDVLDYLLEEGLLTSVADEGLVTISHRGIVEIEHSLNHPEVPTEHFTTQTINNYNNFIAPVGAVQNAPHSTANVNQNFGSDLLEVLSQLQQLRLQFQRLPQDEQAEALELVDGLEAEAKAERRSVARLKAMYSSLMPFVADVGANVLAAAIAQGLGIKS